MGKGRNKRLREWSEYGLLLGGTLLLWEFAVRWGWISPRLLGQPTEIGAYWQRWLATGELWTDTWVTFQEMGLGLAFGFLSGVGVGLLCALFRPLMDLLEPFFVLLNSIPRVLLAPLFILLLGLGVASKVALIITIVFFPIFFNTYFGIKSVPPELIAQLRLLGASRWDLIRHLYLPTALIWVLSSLRLSVGLALVGAILGEYMGTIQGLGRIILEAEQLAQTSKMLAALTFLVAVAVGLDAGLRRVEARFSRWKLQEGK